MTLGEFTNKFFSRPTIAPSATLYVFDREDDADSWIECRCFGSNIHDYELVMVIQSDMKLEYTVKEVWCKAEVQHFYAVEPDVIAVVVEPQESEE